MSQRGWRFWLAWIGAVAGGIIALGLVAFLAWALTPLGPTDTALAALESDAEVTVTDTGDGWVFVPVGQPLPEQGLIFYPGGRVDARSYATFARDLASKGNVVVVARMPLSLAVFKPSAADAFLEDPALDYVKSWAIGGHSLGGAMSATYLGSDIPEQVDGLLLLAAYPSGVDLSGSGLKVGDVTGTADGVLDQANWEAGKALLPAGVAYTSIEGGNHAQFGDYGEQPGDNPATVTAEEQRRQTVRATDRLLEGM